MIFLLYTEIRLPGNRSLVEFFPEKINQGIFYLISDLPEFLQDLFFASRGLGRIGETEMRPLHASEEERTLLVGITTQSDDIFEILLGKLVQILGTVSRKCRCRFPSAPRLLSG